MANQENMNQYQNAKIFYYKLEDQLNGRTPNGIIAGKAYEEIHNEKYIIYFRDHNDFEHYKSLNVIERDAFVYSAQLKALQKMYDDQHNMRLTYDPYFNYKMPIRDIHREMKKLINEGKATGNRWEVLKLHYKYHIKKQQNRKRVCRNCLCVLDNYEPMGNTNRGYRVCKRCKNHIPHFQIDI
jgi:hypothetical protein